MKCIVSLSGGRDSATCLGLAVDKYGAKNVYVSIVQALAPYLSAVAVRSLSLSLAHSL